MWDPSGFLWVSDESTNKIFKLYPDGHTEDMVSLVDPDGSTYDKQHRLLSTASGLRAVIRLSADGKSFETVVDHYQGKKLNTPNDIVMGPDGAIYFTDPIIDMKQQGQVQEQPVSIYRIDAKNNLTLVTKEQTAPNGLAFSPDGKYLYIDDDDTKNVRRYNFHKDGTVSEWMVFGDMTDPVNRGVPDGMKVDKKGNLFVSGPNGVWVWNSKGVHIGTVQMPHRHGQPDVGRPGLLEAVHHRRQHRVHPADEDSGISRLPEEVALRRYTCDNLKHRSNNTSTNTGSACLAVAGGRAPHPGRHHCLHRPYQSVRRSSCHSHEFSAHRAGVGNSVVGLLLGIYVAANSCRMGGRPLRVSSGLMPPGCFYGARLLPRPRWWARCTA